MKPFWLRICEIKILIGNAKQMRAASRGLQVLRRWTVLVIWDESLGRITGSMTAR
jgi:hypothetical protein